MNGQGRPAILAQVLRDVVCDALGTYEDQDLSIFLTNLVQVLDEFRTLFKVAADLNNLLDIMIGGKFCGADIDLNKVFQEILIEIIGGY